MWNEIARDFSCDLIVQYQEEGVMAAIHFPHLRISNLISEAMVAYFA